MVQSELLLCAATLKNFLAVRKFFHSDLRLAKQKNIFSFRSHDPDVHISSLRDAQTHAIARFFSLRCDYDDVDDIQRSRPWQ